MPRRPEIRSVRTSIEIIFRKNRARTAERKNRSSIFDFAYEKNRNVSLLQEHVKTGKRIFIDGDMDRFVHYLPLEHPNHSNLHFAAEFRVVKSRGRDFSDDDVF